MTLYPPWDQTRLVGPVVSPVTIKPRSGNWVTVGPSISAFAAPLVMFQSNSMLPRNLTVLSVFVLSLIVAVTVATPNSIPDNLTVAIPLAFVVLVCADNVFRSVVQATEPPETGLLLISDTVAV